MFKKRYRGVYYILFFEGCFVGWLEIDYQVFKGILWNYVFNVNINNIQ